MVRPCFFLVIVYTFSLCYNSYGQSGRRTSDFMDGWTYYKANNSTFFTDFQLGSRYQESFGQWTRPEVWEPIELPHTYNRDDMQLDRNFFEGKAVYKKRFTVSAEQRNRRSFIYFEGVGATAQIYVNDQYLGVHKGAYSMFSFELTNSLKYDEENTIVVVTDNTSRNDVLPTNQFLFPVYGGIYRPVHWIETGRTGFVMTDEASPGLYIRQRNVTPERAEIQFESKLETREKRTQTIILRTEIQDQNGKSVKKHEERVAVGPQGVTYVQQNITLENPHLWDGVRDPYLYAVVQKVMDSTAMVELDVVRQPLGVRKVELKAGEGVFLNGEKYPMYGVCRHQDWWGYGSALSFEQHKADMLMIREMGATTVRLAHYQQSRDMYALADTLGLLIWAEIPWVNRASFYETDNAKQQLSELIKQNFNHPSIYIWGIHNEVYGTTADSHVPVLSRKLNDLAKTLDPDRPTVAVSGHNTIDRPENLTTDVQGINHYFGWYNGKIGDLEGWASTVEASFPNYKVMLSEYGADGNIDISQEIPSKPSNVVTGSSFPEHYQTETHIRQWAIIERNPIIMASYVWNMFEFAVPAWNRGGVNARNLKGLVTFDRLRKKDSFYWYKANWNPDPMIHLANRRDSVRSNATTRIQLFSNLSAVTVNVNGKKYNAITDANDKHWVVDNVSLKPGENTIEAYGMHDGKRFEDKMIWTLE